MKYTYYPGCSLRGTGRAYEESLLAVFRELGVELEELDDWNCCGATTYMSYDEVQSYALAARNLALATKSGNDLMAPCAACYLALHKTQHYVREYPWIGQMVEHALNVIGYPTDISVRVRHPLDVLFNDVGSGRDPGEGDAFLERFEGCTLLRLPDRSSVLCLRRSEKSHFHGPASGSVWRQDRPISIKDAVLRRQSKGDTAGGGARSCRASSGRGVGEGAEMIATVCPLCQFNLEAFQQEASNAHQFHIPILYFTQLLALAFGIPLKEAGLQRSFVSIKPILAEKEIAYA